MITKVNNSNRPLSKCDTSSDTTQSNQEENWLSLDEKLEYFELQLHGGEMIVDQPLGKEFGAQSK